MPKLRGTVCAAGLGHMKKRMEKYATVFNAATGQDFYPGTLNVRVDTKVLPKEHFKIIGKEIGEPSQDLWFEVCRINNLWAYRIRPVHVLDGSGGHGDNILEIASADYLCEKLGIGIGGNVELFFFR